MPGFALFRFSTYLTTALAFVALAYAEWIFVPVATVMLLAMVVLLALLYRFEDRLSLSLRGANRVGGVLAVGTTLWLGWQLSHPGSGLLESLPWSIRIMPYLGPVLALLVPAKLLRPQKHVGDYWAFQISTLCLVALATAMAEDTIFLGIIFLYLLSFVWSLILFFLMRSSGQVAPLPSRPPEPALVAHTAGGAEHPRRSEAGLVFTTLVASLVLALPFFLVTPRNGGPVWDLTGRKFEVGFSADQLLDLNRTGTLHLNPEIAFEVELRSSTGHALENFPVTPRWKSIDGSYTVYASGKWRRESFKWKPEVLGNGYSGLMTGGRWTPPSFGPDTLQIRYSVPSRLRSHFLLDPLQWDRSTDSPVVSHDPDGPLPWAIRTDGQVQPVLPTRAHRFAIAYTQYVRPDSAQQLSPPLQPVWKLTPTGEPPDISSPRESPESFANQLKFNSLPFFKEYSDRVLQGCVSAGQLTPSALTDRDPDTGLPREQWHSLIAQLLCNHLRSSGQFVYSYNLRRQDLLLDPIEDFVKNTREGHCERFASALVLMLRAQGIPSQFVLGFKGAEYQENQKFVIRHEHAHAWAEALIPMPTDRTGKFYQWLSLDPTPGIEDLNVYTSGSWWEQTLNRSRAMISDYLVGYDSNARERVMKALDDSFRWKNAIYAGLMVVVLLAVARLLRARRRVRRQRPTTGWNGYSQLLSVLKPLGLRPEPGQTPREFADLAAARLRQSLATAPFAQVPHDWTEAHYAVRFGGATMSPARAIELDTALADLKRAIRNGG